MTTLPTLGQGDRLIEDGGPTVRFQALWLEAMAVLEENGGDIEAVEAALAGKQNAAAILSALSALASNGLIARTGAGTLAARTLTGPAAGISVTNGNGVAGNPTLALTNDLAGLEGLTGTGLAQRTGTDTWATVPYEALSFTPSLRIGGSTTGIAYASGGREGRGTRIGNRVLFELTITLTNKGTATGPVTIDGLPGSAVASASGFPWIASVTGITVPAYLVSGSTVLLRQFSGGALVNLTDANFTNTTGLVISGSYPI